MTTFSPDDPSIWHYRRKEGEELPPELVAARRESLRRRRPQPDPPPQPATVSETSRGWPVSTPYVPRPETPAEQYVYEYREYLRTRPDWTEGQVSPYVVEPRNPPPSEDRSLFANQWSFLSPEQEAAMERERDSAVTRLVGSVRDNDPTGAAHYLRGVGPASIKNLRFEHDALSRQDYLTLELRVPAYSMALRQRLWRIMGQPGPMHSQHWETQPPQQLRSERERPILRVQVDHQLDPDYLEQVRRMQERIMTNVVIPPMLVNRITQA